MSLRLSSSKKPPFCCKNQALLNNSRKDRPDYSTHTPDLGIYISDDCSWLFHVNKIADEVWGKNCPTMDHLAQGFHLSIFPEFIQNRSWELRAKFP